MSGHEQSALFFAQLAVILIVCTAVGRLVKLFGQPAVVGEMIAGVVLGPSLFGWWFPDLQARLFPPASMPLLYTVSQVGLTLYMFVVGLEFDIGQFSRRYRGALAVALAGMLAPFALGAMLAVVLRGRFDLFGPAVDRGEAALFMGAAMCITAFPMLARIIHERGLAGSSLGTLALAAGMINDAAAWCVLAVVLASLADAPTIAVTAVAGGGIYAVVVLTVGRIGLRRLGRRVERRGGLDAVTFSGTLALLMAGAWYTDAVGIYAVFGAFVLGVAMPRGVVAGSLVATLGPLTTALLVPLFFAYSGLNTRLGLVATAQLWLVAGVILLVACLGKGVACWLAARACGEAPRDALAIGALMNARGLMELILLNIGLQHGAITPTLFTLMALMAIATTLAATPLFEWAYGRSATARGDDPLPLSRAAHRALGGK